MALGVPGRLRPRIFLTFGTTRVVGRQPTAPAAFTPAEIPGAHFQRLSWPQGTWFCQKEPQKKSQMTPPGIDPGIPHYDRATLTTSQPVLYTIWLSVDAIDLGRLVGYFNPSVVILTYIHCISLYCFWYSPITINVAWYYIATYPVTLAQPVYTSVYVSFISCSMSLTRGCFYNF